MDGSDDVRPASWQRAPDPSLDEMLRRARDAPLGDDPEPPTRYPANLRPDFRRERCGTVLGALIFLAGLFAGVLLVHLVSVAGAEISQLLTPGSTAPQVVVSATPVPPTPTATPAPTPTDTPVPAATPAPTPTPEPTIPSPTGAEIAALVQDFYDTRGPFAGTDVLRDVTNLRIEHLDDAQLTVRIAYEAAAVSAPDTVIGATTRRCTLATASDGSWQVVQMGGPDSCYLR